MNSAYSESEVAAIGQWLREGLSASQIANELTKARGGQRVSRNAVCGVVHRNPALRCVGLAHLPGHGRRLKKNRTTTMPVVQSRPGRAPNPIVIKPKLKPSIETPKVRNAYDAASKHLPLVDLGSRDCHWGVNEPKTVMVGRREILAPGEEHLFCGAPVMEGSRYCCHHAARSFRAD